MKVLAIDHGTKLVGWAVLEDGSIGEHGLIRMEKAYPHTLIELDERLDGLFMSCATKSIVLALEKPMSLRGGHVAQVMIEHYAICKLEALQYDLPIIEVAPPTIKLIVAGAGNADKEAVAQALVHKWGLNIDDIAPPEYYKVGKMKGQLKKRAWDTSDAIALALAAWEMHKREKVTP